MSGKRLSRLPFPSTAFAAAPVSALVAALLLAGCGSGDGSSATGHGSASPISVSTDAAVESRTDGGSPTSPGSPTPTTDPTAAIAPSAPDASRVFNRIATFPVCSQRGSSCDSDETTAAEIIAATADGLTLVYTNSPAKAIGFIDLQDPTLPAPLGALAMGGEPTSVAVLGKHALVAVNTSKTRAEPTGKLVVVDIASRTAASEHTLPGQPDSIAISKDGHWAAVVIENERDEDVNDGALPQLPGGSVVVVSTSAERPADWTLRPVELTGLAERFPEDPEPEYVDINADNVAVVTLQENNHIVLVDLKTASIIRHFPAGTVDLNAIDATDERPNQVAFSESQPGVLREPDGVTWISTRQFVTANEGDFKGGSRGFTVFNVDGSVAWDAGSSLEYAVARIGHTNDRRSDAKGNEPENAEFGRFGRTDYLFVASERSSVIAVQDLSTPNAPALKQLLPTGTAPEGVLAIPSRNLLVVANEEDSREDTVRSSVTVYHYGPGVAAYPTIESADRSDGTPIPWGALSGLAAETASRISPRLAAANRAGVLKQAAGAGAGLSASSDADANANASASATVYAIDDSFYRSNRIFWLDVSQQPARLYNETRIRDDRHVLAGLAATLPDAADDNHFDDVDLAAMINDDGTVNLDPEGIAIGSHGGFWIASEGAGTVGDAKQPVRSANLVLKLDANGVIEEVITLPAEVNARQSRFGLEGIAESDGRLIVVFQRAWGDEAAPRIGLYDLASRTWSFRFYPLDAVASPNKGWVGLSDITALGHDRFVVIERDNQAGPDARIKRLYRFDLAGTTDGQTVEKYLVRDLIDDLRRPAGSVAEKIEGLTRLPSGELLIVNDNDGLDAGNGETTLMRVGKAGE